jgi:hypothetical protein
MSCTADQDVIVLLDGSGSVIPSDETAGSDANFVYQKDLISSLIENSALSGEADESSTGVAQVRYGFVVAGGRGRPEIASQISGDRQALTDALANAQMTLGPSGNGPALFAASQLLRASDPRGQRARPETVVLLTDGGLRRPCSLRFASQVLRRRGVRVMVVLVQPSGDTSAEETGQSFCGIASEPCVDNVLRVDKWEHLADQQGRILSALCPAAASA